MTRKEQLKFCKICKNQKFDAKKGIVCSRTNDVADFVDSCGFFEENSELVAKNRTEQEQLRDNSKRAKLAINIFFWICIINIIAVVSGLYEVDLLERILNGGDFTEEEATMNDLRQGIIGILQSGLYITSMVLFLNWFRRAYGNLHKISPSEPEFEENMAVWGFVIPFANLGRPMKIAREIVDGIQWNLKEMDTNYITAIGSYILSIWWALFLLKNIVGEIAFKLVFKDDTLEQLLTSSQVYLVSDGLDILAAIAAIFMIKQVSKEEGMLFEKLKLATT